VSEGPEKDFKKLVVMVRRLTATKPLDKSLSSKLVSLVVQAQSVNYKVQPRLSIIEVFVFLQ
jgi:hypothetical protein